MIEPCKTRFFVLGCDTLVVAVGHKYLLKLLGDRAFEDIPNTRLRDLKEKMLRYHFRVVRIPGVKNKAADSTSRYPCGPVKLLLPDDIANLHTPAPSWLQHLQHRIRSA